MPDRRSANLRPLPHFGLLLILAALATGCAAPPASEGPDVPDDTGTLGASLSETEAACMLSVASDCAYDLHFFDVTLAWDRRAAEALLNHRAGPDGWCGSADDTPLDSIETLDALPQLGDVALTSLRDFVVSIGCATPEAWVVVDGVPFSEAQAAATVALADSASIDALREQVGISTAAAANIVADRPFDLGDLRAGIERLAQVPMVGPATLERLRQAATPVIIACGVPSTTASGVVFSAGEASAVLDMANVASAEELRLIGGIGTTIASRILDARATAPFVTLADLDAVTGVGPKILTSWRDEVTVDWCSLPHATCACPGATSPGDDMDPGHKMLEAPGAGPAARFYRLLSPLSYAALVELLVAELQATGAPLEALLDQARFARPFDLVTPTPPDAESPQAAAHVATDAIIAALGAADLAATSIGASFDALIAGELEELYLSEVAQWRAAPSLGVTRADLSHAWIFSGELLGLPIEVTVSRKTGHALDVDLGLDW